MGNKTAIIVGLLICGAIYWDYAQNDARALIFAGRLGLDIVDALAVWR